MAEVLEVLWGEISFRAVGLELDWFSRGREV